MTEKLLLFHWSVLAESRLAIGELKKSLRPKLEDSVNSGWKVVVASDYRYGSQNIIRHGVTLIETSGRLVRAAYLCNKRILILVERPEIGGAWRPPENASHLDFAVQTALTHNPSASEVVYVGQEGHQLNLTSEVQFATVGQWLNNPTTGGQ